MRKILYPFAAALTLIGVLMLATAGPARAQTIHSLSGRVLTEADSAPLPGATVSVRDGSRTAVTDAEGYFTLDLPGGDHELETRFLGHAPRVDRVSVPASTALQIVLAEEGMGLQAVEVLSTGFEQLPRERATGSFVGVDNALFNRRVSTGILQRLEDVSPGLILNRDVPGRENSVGIRGQSTLFANSAPLIVVDNFPYDGPIESLNPNDVESVTILRDAAAASIWGARSGNGVIVVTTKGGDYNRAPQVSLNVNTTVAAKPDPFYLPVISVEERIALEQRFFAEGRYTAIENAVFPSPLSPVVETLILERDGAIDAGEAAARLQAFSRQDSRNELLRHVYQPAVMQQYALSVSGGTQRARHHFSVGHDHNRAALRGNGFGRFTLSARNAWRLLDSKLEADAGIYYARTNDRSGTELPVSYPYSQFADSEGRPLPVIRGLRDAYIAEAEQRGLLNWQYFPLQEMGLSPAETASDDIRINGGLKYPIAKGLTVSALYQYWQNGSRYARTYHQESYFTRNEINRFTQVDPSGGLLRPVPLGAIYDRQDSFSVSHSLRPQVGYRLEQARHSLSLLAGGELRRLDVSGDTRRYYGYDPDLGISSPVDYQTQFPQYYSPNTRNNIVNRDSHSGSADRTLSAFANAGYRYLDRYGLSLSARRDASNLFGAETNRRGVPLWSAGLSWDLSDEPFYGLRFLPYSRIRATFGYNGNLDRTLSSLTTARYLRAASNTLTGAPFALIDNPPNPGLRWERNRMLNLGWDFEFARRVLYGRVEAYRREGIDLIGVRPVPASTGLSTFRGNYASTRTRGLDAELNSTLSAGRFAWEGTFFLSALAEKVTGYDQQATTADYLVYGQGAENFGQMPFMGRPLHAIYSFAWAGLDGDTGNPVGFVNGEPSTDYLQLYTGTTPDQLVYNGSGRPTVFGAFRNGFRYGGLSLSVNVSYRMGYYYKRKSIDYNEMYRGNGGHADYRLRWMQPGDERHTTVPSMPPNTDTFRELFYRNVEGLVERGDHIRLQDIRIAYAPGRPGPAFLPFRSAEVYLYADNLGILWKASDDPVDPDFRSFRPTPSIALGIRLDL